MCRRWLIPFVSVLAGALALALFIGGARGQEGERPTQGEPETMVGSSLTYQGMLEKDGLPYNGACDFDFYLYDAPSGGNLIGPSATLTGHPVSDGLFTAELPFAPNAFNGDARWLETWVRCPAGPGNSWATLAPRQPLTAAPYAFSLQPGAVISSSFSGPELTLGNSGGDGLYVDGVGQHGLLVDGPGVNGVEVRSAGAHGLYVGNAASEGVKVESPGANGVYVGDAGADGVYVDHAAGDGIAICRTGTETSCLMQDHLSNGVEVGSAQDYGVYVGSAGATGFEVGPCGGHGVYVLTAGLTGFVVITAHDDGFYVEAAGSPEAYVYSAASNGFEVAGAEGNGLWVGHAGESGVYVDHATGDGLAVCTAGTETSCVLEDGVNNGIEIGAAEDAGVLVHDAGSAGVAVGSVGGDGLYVQTAEGDGMNVMLAGSDGLEVYWAQQNGVRIGTAGGHGLLVEDSGSNGVEVRSSGDHGVYVGGPTRDGVKIENPGGDGVLVNNAADDGIDVNSATSYAGEFTGNIYVSGNVEGARLATFGVNAGEAALQPGDVVAVLGTAASPFPEVETLFRVSGAAPGQPLLGVVQGYAEVVSEQRKGAEPVDQLVSRVGAAAPGAYVSIIIYGPTQVRAVTPVAVGDRVTVDEAGAARPLRTVTVDGVQLAENAPTLGTALGEADADGMVWVLVNPG
jgi:hypothetical protein